MVLEATAYVEIEGQRGEITTSALYKEFIHWMEGKVNNTERLHFEVSIADRMDLATDLTVCGFSQDETGLQILTQEGAKVYVNLLSGVRYAFQKNFEYETYMLKRDNVTYYFGWFNGEEDKTSADRS